MYSLAQILLLIGTTCIFFAELKQDSSAPIAADHPVARDDRNSRIAHELLLEKDKRGKINIYFEGDSITRRWGATDYPELLANWSQNFFGWNAANFGWGGDTTQNILWSLHNGELDGVHPKVIVLLAGTNNLTVKTAFVDNEQKASEVTRGIKAILEVRRAKAPEAVIILMGIFPRNDNVALLPVIKKINENLAGLADGKKIRYLNINDRLADKGRKVVG